jgi:hypothetical protein
MASLNSTQLVKDMTDAFRGQLAAKWPDIRTYAESEAKKLAQSIKMLEELRIQKKITKEQAKLHLQIQKNSSRMSLLTLEDMGLLAVEGAINAALAAVKTAVNTALGFALI